jgi:hypothetical protein
MFKLILEVIVKSMISMEYKFMNHQVRFLWYLIDSLVDWNQEWNKIQ